VDEIDGFASKCACLRSFLLVEENLSLGLVGYIDGVLIQVFFPVPGPELVSNRSFPLHFLQGLGDERSDVMRGCVAVGKGLIQHKVGQRETR
jgi:hypothetical protein